MKATFSSTLQALAQQKNRRPRNYVLSHDSNRPPPIPVPDPGATFRLNDGTDFRLNDGTDFKLNGE